MKTKNSPYLKLNRIEFVVTYQCSGRCKHCSFGKSLGQSGADKCVRMDKVAEAIEELSRLFDIKSVMTFGGEPLLYSDVVCAIHKTASECGIESRQLITNGCFTRNAEKRRDVVFELKNAGVNNLLLSADAFHQETIPLELVFGFARDVIDAGIDKAKLHPAWVVNEEHENCYNAKTREILSFLSGSGMPVSHGNDIFLAGNAREYLTQYYEKQMPNLAGKCGEMPYTDRLTEISALSIVPNGDVMICGFVIGNIYTESVADIVERYDPYENDCMRAILEGGSSALIDYAECSGITLDLSQCYSLCDACYLLAGQIFAKE